MKRQSLSSNYYDCTLSRRALLKSLLAAGGGLSAAALLGACAPPAAPAAQPTSAAAPGTQAPAAAATSAPAAAAKTEPTKPPATAAASQATPVKRGGDMVVALQADVSTLDPLTSNSNPNNGVLLQIYGRLLQLDEKANLVPSLAQSWEEAKDHLSWTLRLRPGVKFHDGTDLDAAAVKFNLDRFMDPKAASPRSGELAYLTGVTVVDPLTVKLQLSKPNASLMYSFMDHAGDVLSPAAVKQYGEDIARRPVGTGPFVFKEWVKNDRIVLVRNENYWNRGYPYLNSITYKPIADATARLNGIRTGALHFDRRQAARDLTSLKNDPNFQVIIRPSTTILPWRFNLAVPPLDKKEIRQALCWAVDTAAIGSGIFFGAGTPATQLPAPSVLGYDPDLTMYSKQGLAKAKTLLAAGGQPNGFKMSMMVNANAVDDGKVAQAIKSDLEKIGVTVELQLLEQTKLIQEMNANRFTSVIAGHSGKFDPFFSFSRFFQSQSTLNNYAYKSPEFDKLLEQSAATADAQERAKVYRQISRLLAEDAVWCYIRHAESAHVLRKEVKGYVYNPDELEHLDNVWLE